MFSNKEALDIVLATVLSHRVTLPPVWLVIIAPPSTGKTSLLDKLPSGAPPKQNEIAVPGLIIALDCLTPRTLLSGLNSVSSTGLLERVKDNIIVMRELSTISTRSEDLREIVGLLRRIYDGQVDSSWGTGKTVTWTGHLTFIMAGVKHPASIDAELGARMLTIKLTRSETDNDRLLKRNHVSNKTYVDDCLIRSVPQAGDAELDLVKPYAQSLAVLRTSIFRDRDGQITDDPEYEEPHRLVGQLGSLAMCLKIVNPDVDINNTLWRIIADTMPQTRLIVIQLLCNTPLPGTDIVGIISERYMIGRNSVLRAIDDLRALRIIKKTSVPSGDTGRPLEMLSISPKWVNTAIQLKQFMKQENENN